MATEFQCENVGGFQMIHNCANLNTRQSPGLLRGAASVSMETEAAASEHPPGSVTAPLNPPTAAG